MISHSRLNPMTPAKRRFGQNFLVDRGVVNRIIEAVSPRPDETIVEIGPGRGALTARLVETSGRLVAIEFDRELVPQLRAQFAGSSNLTLVEADALTVDFCQVIQPAESSRVVANLPYNIATAILQRLIEQRHCLKDMTLMLQREVVDRIVAPPGGDAYGRLTVMLAPWVHAERLFEIGPGAFQPPPKVWSAVVRLTVLPQPAFEISTHFGAVVAAAFSHRRKTLRNALKDIVTREQIEACGIDPGMRPETLAPEAFNALAQTLNTN